MQLLFSPCFVMFYIHVARFCCFRCFMPLQIADTAASCLIFVCLCRLLLLIHIPFRCLCPRLIADSNASVSDYLMLPIPIQETTKKLQSLPISQKKQVLPLKMTMHLRRPGKKMKRKKRSFWHQLSRLTKIKPHLPPKHWIQMP